MNVNKLRNRMVELRQRSLYQAHRLNEGSRGWLGVLLGAFNDALKPTSAMKAAAIAYFTLFSLFPLVLLSISVASRSLGALIDQHNIVQDLEFILPGLGLLLGKNIDEVIRARGPITGVAFLGLIWSASTIFYTLNNTTNDIWGHAKGRAVWKRRGVSILFVLAIVGPALMLASLAGSIITTLRNQLPNLAIPISGSIGYLSAIFLDVALFLIIYAILPHGHATRREVLLGALGAGILWELAKKLFLYFISSYLSLQNLVYGSVTAIIAILTWAYFTGLIFLFGAYLSMHYHHLRQQRLKRQATLLEKGN